MTASNESHDDTEESTDHREALASLHQESGAGGHWWNQWDEADEPDWYIEKNEKPLTPAADGENLPPEHQPNVPDDWDPTDYARYRCKVCGDPCINPVDSVYHAEAECRSCYLIPDLDQAHGATDADVRDAIQSHEADD